MDKEKRLDSLMIFTVAVYLLVLMGFIEVAAAAYLLVLTGWLAKEMYRGFIIGQVERKEYKEREKAWKTEAVNVGKKEGKQSALSEKCIENVVLDPL